MSIDLCSNAPIAWHFVVAAVVTSSLILAGVFANVFLLFLLAKTSFFPGNVRLMMANIGFTLIVGLSLFGWRNFDAWRAIIRGYSQSNQAICGIRTTSIAVVMGGGVSTWLICLGIERLMSTRKLLKHQTLSDKASRSMVLLIALVWLLVLVTGAVGLFTEFKGMLNTFSSENRFATCVTFAYLTMVGIISNNSSMQLLITTLIRFNATTKDAYPNPNQTNISILYNSTIPLCWCTSRTVRNSSAMIPLALFYILSELMGISLYLFTLRSNRRKLNEWNVKSKRHDLTVRFQLRQNVIITEVMLPASVAQAIGQQIQFIALICTSIFFAEHFDSQINLASASTLSIVLPFASEVYALAHPICTILQSHTLFDYVKNMMLPTQVHNVTVEQASAASIRAISKNQIVPAPCGQESHEIQQPTGLISKSGSEPEGQPASISKDTWPVKTSEAIAGQSSKNSRYVFRSSGRDVRNYQLPPIENMRVIESIWARGKV